MSEKPQIADEPFIKDASSEEIFDMFMRFGEIMTRTNADGTVDLYTPPQYRVTEASDRS